MHEPAYHTVAQKLFKLADLELNAERKRVLQQIAASFDESQEEQADLTTAALMRMGLLNEEMHGVVRDQLEERDGKTDARLQQLEAAAIDHSTQLADHGLRLSRVEAQLLHDVSERMTDMAHALDDLLARFGAAREAAG